jgi:energy-coupling factor transporter transmembrane protein EcfT
MQNLNQVFILLFLALVVFLAPFWIPIAIAVIATTLVVLGGIFTIFSMPTCVVVAFVLGIFGILLLFGTGVPAISQILQRILYSLGVESSDSLRWLPFTKSLQQNENKDQVTSSAADIERKDSWDNFT